MLITVKHTVYDTDNLPPEVIGKPEFQEAIKRKELKLKVVETTKYPGKTKKGDE